MRSTTSSRVPESPLNGLNRPSRQAVRSLRSWILQPRGTDHAKKESRTVAGNSATNPEPGLSWFQLGSILAPSWLRPVCWPRRTETSTLSLNPIAGCTSCVPAWTKTENSYQAMSQRNKPRQAGWLTPSGLVRRPQQASPCRSVLPACSTYIVVFVCQSLPRLTSDRSNKRHAVQPLGYATTVSEAHPHRAFPTNQRPRLTPSSRRCVVFLRLAAFSRCACGFVAAISAVLPGGRQTRGPKRRTWTETSGSGVPP